MKAMTSNRRVALLGALLLGLVPAGTALAQAVVDNSAPQKLVETSAKLLLADLDANRAAYKRDISGLYKVIDLVGPLVVASGFGLYSLTNFYLGRFRRQPYEFIALSTGGVLFALARLAYAPSASTAVAAAASVALLGFLYWFFFSYSMYGAREDRPRVGDRFPPFALTASDGSLYDSAAARGTRKLYIFYRGSW